MNEIADIVVVMDRRVDVVVTQRDTSAGIAVVGGVQGPPGAAPSTITLSAVPATLNAAGAPGAVAADSTGIYFCYAPDAWLFIAKTSQ